MKKVIYIIVAIVITGSTVWLANYLFAGRPVQKKLQADPRNEGIELSAHYRYFILPNTLVINLTDTKGDHTQLDVFRTVLQASQALKGKTFTEVVFAFKNASKFKISGTYFKELGETYDLENPLYTVRSFPEHVFNMDGSSPYAKADGGVFAAFAEDMDQFKDFSRKWYGNDLNEEAE
ncbi:hypothetical protein [Mucilaginibacter sp. PAMB04168]|uniref:hypothetical protein n=1 Tax=Mucilaginibacter sp. PAMB04168 TaxID=3138567 RepID=UPI0031F67F31